MSAGPWRSHPTWSKPWHPALALYSVSNCQCKLCVCLQSLPFFYFQQALEGVTQHRHHHGTLCLPFTCPLLALYLPFTCPVLALHIPFDCPLLANVNPMCDCSLCRPVSSPACQQAVEGSRCCMSSWASCAAPSPNRRPSGEPSTRSVRACMLTGTPDSCSVHVLSFA